MNPLCVPVDAPICATGKRPFRTEEEAQKALGSAKHLRREDPGKCRVPGSVEQGCFECRVCHWWHLNSRPFHARRSTHAARGTRRR